MTGTINPRRTRAGAYSGAFQIAGGIAGGGGPAQGGGPSVPIVGSTSLDIASFSTQWTIDPANIPGIQSGDLIVVALTYQASGGVASTVTSTGGTTTKLGSTSAAASSNYQDLFQGVYAGSPISFDFSVTSLGGITVAAFRNSTIGPNTSINSAGNTSDINALGLTTTVSNSYFVAFTTGNNGDATRNFGSPQTAFDATWARGNGGTGTRVQFVIAASRIANPGAVSFKTVTASGLCDRFAKTFELIAS